MKHLIIIAVATTVVLGQALAANLLLTNPDYDSEGTFYRDAGFNTTANAAGWTITVGSGGLGVANDQGNIGTPNFAYSMGGSTWTTAAGSRATVAAGDAYVFSYSGRLDNQTVPGGGTVFVDWFDSSSSLVSSTIDFGSDFQSTSRVAGAPYGEFTHSITAPINATSAGVRWGTAGVTGGGVIADDFSIAAIPEPSGFALLFGSLGGLCLRRRRA